MEATFEERINRYIRETGHAFEPFSCFYNRDGQAFQLEKLEETIDFEGESYWVIIIEKVNYDPEDIECIEDTETIFEKYIKL